MARSDPQVNFRIPAHLNDRLKEAAAEENRSITAELVTRLERSFMPEILAPEEIDDLSEFHRRYVSEVTTLLDHALLIMDLDARTFGVQDELEASFEKVRLQVFKLERYNAAVARTLGVIEIRFRQLQRQLRLLKAAAPENDPNAE